MGEAAGSCLLLCVSHKSSSKLSCEVGGAGIPSDWVGKLRPGERKRVKVTRLEGDRAGICAWELRIQRTSLAALAQESSGDPSLEALSELGGKPGEAL